MYPQTTQKPAGRQIGQGWGGNGERSVNPAERFQYVQKLAQHGNKATEDDNDENNPPSDRVSTKCDLDVFHDVFALLFLLIFLSNYSDGLNR